MNLTHREMEYVEAFIRLSDRMGTSPTMEEWAEEMGVTKVSVFEKVNQLQKKGVLKKPGRHVIRGIKLIGYTRPVSHALLARIRSRLEELGEHQLAKELAGAQS